MQLAHGTWMYWDGREQPHCSAVPCVPKDDRLLSLFVFAHVPSKLCSVFEREQVCGDAIMARQEQENKEAAIGHSCLQWFGNWTLLNVFISWIIK